MPGRLLHDRGARPERGDPGRLAHSARPGGLGRNPADPTHPGDHENGLIRPFLPPGECRMHPVTRHAAALLLVSFNALAFAQAQNAPAATPDYQPSVGQEGKDVVWVPTPQALVDRMLEMAKLTPKDFLMDLGSGDGRTVITAAKRGTTAVGIEYNPDMVALSQKNAQAAGVTGKASFRKADLFESDLSK